MITNHSHDMLMIRIMMMNQDNYLKGLWIVFPRVSSTASLETESRPSSTSRFDFNYHEHHDCLCPIVISACISYHSSLAATSVWRATCGRTSRKMACAEFSKRGFVCFACSSPSSENNHYNFHPFYCSLKFLNAGDPARQAACGDRRPIHVNLDDCHEPCHDIDDI